jgi:hypothetical protein
MNRLSRIARAFIIRPKSEWHPPIDRLWFILLVSLLILVMIASLPVSVRNLYATTLRDSIPWLRENKDSISEWLSSLRLIFEIFTAIFIGGTIFAKSRATSLENKLKNYEASLLLKSTKLMDDTEAAISERFRKIQELLTEPRAQHGIRNFFRLLNLSYGTASLLYRTVRRTNRKPILAVVVTSFPGGLYGFLAFTFLFLVCICKLSQIYIAMLPKT